MSCKNGSKHMENKCQEPPKNKLDKFIKDCSGGIVTLPERAFHCPPCLKSEPHRPCRIPSWIRAPCDGVKCFNCPPKYLCFDRSSCSSIRAPPASKGND